jgi:hypothetical protein
MKKLNAKGFAHWIIPALAVVVIGGIGTYMITASHALTPVPAGGTPTWHIVKSTGTISKVVAPYTTYTPFSYDVKNGTYYRLCMTARAYTTGTTSIGDLSDAVSLAVSGVNEVTATFGGTTKKVCTPKEDVLIGSVTLEALKPGKSLLVKQITVEHYY